MDDPSVRVYRELHMWTQNLFQNFGWMVLAKEHKHTSQINGYTESMNKLLEALKEKQSSPEYASVKNDMAVLETNVTLLQVATKKLLGFRKSSSR